MQVTVLKDRIIPDSEIVETSCVKPLLAYMVIVTEPVELIDNEAVTVAISSKASDVL